VGYFERVGIGTIVERMDQLEKAVLRATALPSGVIANSKVDKDRLDTLVAAGLVELVPREAPFPAYPVPPPVYRITHLGRTTLEKSD
jgi:hypothetical protein